jgi:hypothetical protein
MSFSARRGHDFAYLFSQTPVTLTILMAWAVSLVLELGGISCSRYLAFVPSGPQALTGLLTYPLAVGPDPLYVLLLGLGFYWVGGSLERGWGWRSFLLFLLGVNTSGLLLVQIGYLLQSHGSLWPWADPWLMVFACAAVWGLLYPRAGIMLFFVLPISGQVLAWVMLIVSYVVVFPRVPGLLWFVWGLFGLGGMGFAYLYLRNGWARGLTISPGASRPLRHPRSGVWETLKHGYREWQRKRRAAQLSRMFGDFEKK